jgi:hypothetical protein
MTTPTSDEFRAGHAVLIEVLNVLGSHVDGMVVIGGWVPELMFPNHGHIGSLDVDLAVDGRMIRPGAYESIRKRLVAAGYVQVATHAASSRKNSRVSGPSPSSWTWSPVMPARQRTAAPTRSCKT